MNVLCSRALHCAAMFAVSAVACVLFSCSGGCSASAATEKEKEPAKTTKVVGSLMENTMLGDGTTEIAPGAYSVNTPVFRKIDLPLTLKRGVRTVQYYTGPKKSGERPQRISFQVCNQNLTSISVAEWRKNEQDNIRLFIAPCADGKLTSIPEKSWKLVHPQPDPAQGGRLVQRQSVQIAPGTYLTVDVDPIFLEKWNPAKDGDIIAVRAELNLESVSAKPVTFLIRVREKGLRIREKLITD